MAGRPRQSGVNATALVDEAILFSAKSFGHIRWNPMFEARGLVGDDAFAKEIAARWILSMGLQVGLANANEKMTSTFHELDGDGWLGMVCCSGTGWHG